MCQAHTKKKRKFLFPLSTNSWSSFHILISLLLEPCGHNHDDNHHCCGFSLLVVEMWIKQRQVSEKKMMSVESVF